MLKAMAEKVIIAGCGVTGSITAFLLKSKCPKVIAVTVYDKSRGSGGRMSTSRCPSDPTCTVDLGAQYISATPEYYEKHKQFYNDLESNGILKPMTALVEGEREHPAGTKHFVTPSGVGSISKHFIQKSDAKVEFSQQIKKVSLSDKKWQVTSDSGQIDTCDCLLLTLPVPQILQLEGDIKDIIAQQPDVSAKLEKVEYSSRFALGLFYQPGSSISVPWSAKYFYDDPCIRYVGIDNRKRGTENSEVGPSVVVHTSVPFGLENISNDKDHVCSNLVLPQLKKLLPDLPKHHSVKAHKWRYSQVFKSYEGQPGVVILNRNPLLILAGDGFTFSKFDGCVESAFAALNAIKKYSEEDG